MKFVFCHVLWLECNDTFDPRHVNCPTPKPFVLAILLLPLSSSVWPTWTSSFVVPPFHLGKVPASFLILCWLSTFVWPLTVRKVLASPPDAMCLSFHHLVQPQECSCALADLAFFGNFNLVCFPTAFRLVIGAHAQTFSDVLLKVVNNHCSQLAFSKDSFDITRKHTCWVWFIQILRSDAAKKTLFTESFHKSNIHPNLT